MAREGIPFVGVALLLAAFCWWGAEYAPVAFFGVGLFAVLASFIAFFFRDPERTPPAGDNLILAAADGRIVGIDHIEHDGDVDGAAFQISTFLSPLDVHVNRSPVGGVVDFVKWHKGRFHAAFIAAASTENEQSIIGIRHGANLIVVKQIVGVIARRIVCYLSAGDTTERGARFGMIRFGSRVDLIVPAATQLQVKVGDRVKAGETIIGIIDDV